MLALRQKGRGHAKAAPKRAAASRPPRKAPQPKAAKAKPRRARREQRVGVPSLARYAAFDPTTSTIPPTLMTLSGVYPLNVSARYELDTVFNERQALFFSGWGGESNNFVHVRLPFGSTNPTFATSAPAILGPSAGAGGATSSKISKVGFRLANSTPSLYLGGRAYLVKLDQRIALPAAAGTMTTAQWNTMLDGFKTLPPSMCLPINMSEFAPGGRAYDRPCYCHVVDEVDYNVFENNAGALPLPVSNANVSAWFDHIGLTSISAELTRPMSTIVLIIESPQGTSFLQNLTFSIDAQYLTRWPLTTVPGQNAQTVHAADPVHVQDARRGALGGFVARGSAADMPAMAHGPIAGAGPIGIGRTAQVMARAGMLEGFNEIMGLPERMNMLRANQGTAMRILQDFLPHM